MPLWLWIVLALAAFYGALFAAGYRWQSRRRPHPTPPPRRRDTADGWGVTADGCGGPIRHADGRPFTPAEDRAVFGAIGTHHNPALWADPTSPEEGNR